MADNHNKQPESSLEKGKVSQKQPPNTDKASDKQGKPPKQTGNKAQGHAQSKPDAAKTSVPDDKSPAQTDKIKPALAKTSQPAKAKRFSNNFTSVAAFNKFSMRHFKRTLKSSRKKSFLVVVLMPWLLVALYYVFIAADFYESSASFMIKEANSQAGTSTGGVTLAAIAGFSSQHDEHILNEHILSVDMMKALDASLNLKAHFAAHPEADFVSRLSSSATQEDFLKYYQSLLDIHYNDLSGLLTVKIKAYDADYAQQVLAAILKHSETLVNDKSLELAESQLSFVRAEIEESAQRLVKARQALIAFQDSHHMFSPEQQGQTVSGIISSLEAELAQAEAERRRLLSYQRGDSPQVIALKDKVNSLKAQIKHVNKRLVKSESQDTQTINEVYGQYKELELEVEVAQTTYLSALTALESARIEASRKLKHLLVINEPYTPEEALYPKKLYNLFTLAIILLLVFGLFRMIATTIREHID